MTQLTFNRLTHAQVEALVTQIARGKALPNDIMQQIAAKTDGVPLFVEELTKMLLESGLLREADDHRLTGKLLLAQSVTHQAEAETCFCQALATARRQQAKAIELRTAVSLSRLWQQQGKWAEAHALLAPVYSWFTEGFDTTDLQEAKALLEALGT